MKLNLPEIVIRMLERLNEAGFEAYVVGGAVRDLLVGKEVKDWDITTNAKPEEILPLFEESFYDNNFGTVMVAPKHVAKQFKIKIVEDDLEVFDITTYRKEYGYKDKRRPDKIEWGKTLEDDVKRRDFTINAMALKQEKNGQVTIVDKFEGKKDLKNKLIRAVGDPKERFSEDALRMMRAIRLGAQMGFIVEEKTLEAIRQQADLIVHISWERISDELLKILKSNYPADGILMMQSSGLLEFVMPELLETRGVDQVGRHKLDVWNHSVESLRECPSTDPIVRLAALLHDVGKPIAYREGGPRGVTFYGHEVVGERVARNICQRLKLSKKQTEKIATLVRWHMFTYDPKMTDAAIRRFIKRVGLENINDMMLLRVGDRKGGGSKATSWRLRELQERIGQQLYEPMSISDLKVDGHEVMKTLNIKPGPKIGKILNQLFEEVMEDTSRNEKKYLLKRVKELA